MNPNASSFVPSKSSRYSTILTDPYRIWTVNCGGPFSGCFCSCSQAGRSCLGCSGHYPVLIIFIEIKIDLFQEVAKPAPATSTPTPTPVVESPKPTPAHTVETVTKETSKMTVQEDEPISEGNLSVQHLTRPTYC